MLHSPELFNVSPIIQFPFAAELKLYNPDQPFAGPDLRLIRIATPPASIP